ncbi:MAG TPA: GlsB/YeaQ/YmgE family stress response membrane protein [Thermoanaerobaculia bacterium]|nr:GlsB/YeaQ/YmgE family stress response membrane protein [Thermoanaerobaculia bacterium]
MGIALWIVSGVAAFGCARIVPFLRTPGWLAELSAGSITALLLGWVATALDFGGWNEPDWRAALFAFAGAFAVIGLVRLTMSGNSGGAS